MPEHDPEQELGPKIASAFQSQADAADRAAERGTGGRGAPASAQAAADADHGRSGRRGGGGHRRSVEPGER